MTLDLLQPIPSTCPPSLYRCPHGRLWIVGQVVGGLALRFGVEPWMALGGPTGMVACARRSGGLWRGRIGGEPWRGAQYCAWPLGEGWVEVDLGLGEIRIEEQGELEEEEREGEKKVGG